MLSLARTSHVVPLLRDPAYASSAHDTSRRATGSALRVGRGSLVYGTAVYLYGTSALLPGISRKRRVAASQVCADALLAPRRAALGQPTFALPLVVSSWLSLLPEG